MDISREFLLGFIKIHILYHAQNEGFCGVDMMKELKRHGYRIGPGTLYPALHKLQEDGYLESEKRTEKGRARIYYRATSKGRQALRHVRPKIAFPASTRYLALGGGVSGFIVGLIGTGGALRATFLTGLKIEKEKYIATAAVIALGTDATRIPSYLASGFLTEQYYYLVPILFGIALGGSYVGRKIVGRIDQVKFRKMVLIAVILASVKFIVDGITAVQL